MGLFHVYVEAPDPSPDAVRRLALVISQKYGVPAPELEKRLAAGRFRVKANVDRATADTYAKALTESGAIVKVEDAVPTQPVPVVPPPAPESVAPAVRAPKPSGEYATVKRPSTPSVPTPVSALPPREARTSTPPAGVPRPSASSLPPQNKSQPIMASGLSAAFTESAQQQTTDLGALSSDALKLSSLDGKETGSQTAITEDVAPPSVSFAPPAQATKPTLPPPKPAKPKDEPVDLFAPPDAEEAQFKVELAADEIEHYKARAAAASTPPAGVEVVPAAPVATPQLTAAKKRMTPAPGVPVTVAADAQETPRARFAAGVILAILIGFVPAHLIAASREASAFEKADAAVVETQASALDADSYAKLDEFRDKQLELKQSKKRSIAWQSMLIWAVVGGAVAYVWFYRVPWDKLSKRTA